MRLKVLLLLPFVLNGAFLPGQTFSPPAKFTDGARKYQISRTSSRTMAFDSEGTLHVTYWAGGSVTTPALPSYVYHRTWTLAGGWGPQTGIDDSEQSGMHVGGRHPALVVLPNDTVWITWHDHRHGTSSGSWIDNIEIYGDFKPASGVFSSSDVRLTTSVGPGSGLNGYTPRVAVNPATGVISVAWYDFEADANVSDIYIKSSDASGNFNLAEGFAAMRSTHAGSRGGSPAYTVPDMAVDSSGTRHLTWAGGTGADVNLYYAAAAPGSPLVTETLLATSATDYFDPPHITVAANGNVWIACADDTLPNNENLVLLRRRAGQSSFDPAFTVKNGPAREYSLDHAADPAGMIHLAWVDERSGRHIYYGRFNPASGLLESETRLTQTSGNWIRPAIIEHDGHLYILFEQDTNPLAAGDLWFSTTFTPNAVDASLWLAYE